MSFASTLERARMEGTDLQDAGASLVLRITALLATASEQIDNLKRDLSPSPTHTSHWEFTDGKAVCISGDAQLKPVLGPADAQELFQLIKDRTNPRSRIRK